MSFFLLRLHLKFFEMTLHEIKINNALISVYNKDNLKPIIDELVTLNVNIYSTGGTKQYIESLGVKVISVEELTHYPSILGGRVKTLHPKIFGGILARRDNPLDKDELLKYEIPIFDLIIVDLYPFEEISKTEEATEEEVIENIDIGGISLIRAAAKNFTDTLIIPSRREYETLLTILKQHNGISNINMRKKMAMKAFSESANYDTQIHNYFNEENEILHFNGVSSNILRYGENPHQMGTFYGDLKSIFKQVHGKELSYNNLLDLDAAISLLTDFNEPSFAILKHNNPCGVASRPNIIEAWKDALAGDPLSAFGGILICNQQLDKITAAEIDKLFFEIIVAPAFEQEALSVLQQKKNRIILIQNNLELPKKQVRTLLNGFIMQDRDVKTETITDLQVVTQRKLTEQEKTDLIFANKIVKHTKSNAIVLAKNKQLLASGTGQTSRVDALLQAIEKAKKFNHDLNNSVMSSDAFFPFPDCVEIACKAGITAVIQPGGSVKDKESIHYCNEHNMAMAFTGIRHFKH